MCILKRKKDKDDEPLYSSDGRKITPPFPKSKEQLKTEEMARLARELYR